MTPSCVTRLIHKSHPQSQDPSHLTRGHKKKKVQRKEEGWGDGERGVGQEGGKGGVRKRQQKRDHSID